MFIDTVKSMVAENMKQPQQDHRMSWLARLLPNADCFKIDGLLAFQAYLNERKRFAEHMGIVKGFLVEHEAELQKMFSKPIWMEWATWTHTHERPIGFLFASFGEDDIVSTKLGAELHAGCFLFQVNEQDYVAMQTYFEDKEKNLFTVGEKGGLSDFQEAKEDWDRLTQLVAHSCYFRLNPAIAVVTNNPAQGGQEERKERRNARGTKIVKAARSKVQMILIDGVTRVVVKGVPKFRVHARGWHMRRHEVREHWRHLASGKVVRVRPHLRGDENLGWAVPTPEPEPKEKRYKIDPAAEFYPKREV